MRGQVVDLLDVEDSIALHVGDLALSFFARGFILPGFRDAVGIDHQSEGAA